MEEAATDTFVDPWRCTRCGACLAVCPTYRVLGRETESPRGRLALARAWAEGQLAPGAHAADLVYRCALCAACNVACPGGLQVDEILLGLRRELAGRHLLPEPLAGLQAAVCDRHNILGEDQAARNLWRADAGGSAAEPQAAPIVYFVGCVSALFPSSYTLARETVRLLQAAGLQHAVLGGEEWCCGYPLLLNGQEEAMGEVAGELVRRVVALGATTVVTSCPSCYHAWRHIYPRLVPGLQLDILHTSELLLRAVQEGRLRPTAQDLTVTYHDPCDLGRRSGLYEPPRELLQAIPDLQLVEMRDRRENGLCCGGGGNLESVAPGLVQEAAARRLQQAQETGAAAIVTACPQCRRTLTAAARRERVRLRVWDVVEVVGRAVADEPA